MTLESLVMAGEQWVTVEREYMMNQGDFRQLLGTDLPIIQAPMAGVQGSALTIAVSEAGGLGSLPCAMLGMDDIVAEINTIKRTTKHPHL